MLSPLPSASPRRRGSAWPSPVSLGGPGVQGEAARVVLCTPRGSHGNLEGRPVREGVDLGVACGALRSRFTGQLAPHLPGGAAAWHRDGHTGTQGE